MRPGNLNLPVSGAQEYTFAISGQREVIWGKTDMQIVRTAVLQAPEPGRRTPAELICLQGGLAVLGAFASGALINITGLRSMKSTPPAQRSVLQPK